MRYVLCILIAVAMLFAVAPTCSTEFYEDVVIQVLDARLRPIEGSTVNLTYQVSTSTGRGYFTTKNFYTNSAGKTTIPVHNQEKNPAKLDCNIVLRAGYADASVQQTFIAQHHPTVIQPVIPLYNVLIIVEDQNKKRLTGADVWIGEQNKTTGADGTASFKVKNGTTTVYVKYGEGKTEEELVVEMDTIKTVGVGLYPFTINVKDDNGAPLAATVRVGEKEYDVKDGTLTIDALATASPIVIARHGNVEKPVDVDLTIKSDYTVIFDLNPPTIMNVSIVESNSVLRLAIVAEDPGRFGSGVADVTFEYDINALNRWAMAPLYLKKKGVFIAEIPRQVPGTRVDFMIEAFDAAGNKAHRKGRLDVPAEEESAKPEEKPQEEESDEGFPWLVVGGGVLIIAVIIIGVYLKVKQGGE